MKHVISPFHWRRARLGRAALLTPVAVVALAVLALAAGTAGARGPDSRSPAAHGGDRLIDFETAPTPPDWTPLAGQYHAQGVDFLREGDADLPVIVNVGSLAHSGTHVAAEGCFVEFCAQDVLARFTSVHSHVNVWVGLLGPASQARKVTLEGLGLDGTVQATDSETVSGGNIATELAVGSPTGSIAGMRITVGSPAAVHWAIDDLRFDLPFATDPDFGLAAKPPLMGFVRPGESIDVPITINRVNGSEGSIGFSASGTPAGVGYSFSPVSTTGDATTLHLQAARDAVAGAASTVVVTGKPASSAVGPASRSTSFALRVGNPTTAKRDAVRITQGLERDYRALVDYDDVAGKDTLVRTWFSGPGAPAVDSAECRVSHGGSVVATVPAVWTGTGTPHVNAKPATSGAPSFDCLVAGSLLRDPGSYEFGTSIHLKDALGDVFGPESLRWFAAGSDIRLLIYPWMVRPVDANYRPYGPESLLTLAETLQSFQRIWPVRSGVGAARTAAPKAGEILPGVRYTVIPPFQCLKPSIGSTYDCDLETRNTAELQRAEWNKTAGYDRIDWAVTLGQSAASGGGSDCWFGRTAGIGQDLRPPATTYQAYILAQELGHCLGAVDPSSPNSMPGNAMHANDVFIPKAPGSLPAVNLLDGRDVTDPQSAMYPWFTADTTLDRNMFLEGMEWNLIRAKAVATYLGVAGPGKAAAVRPRAFRVLSERTFVWMGSVAANGRARLQYSFVRRGSPDPSLAPHGQTGRYELAVRGRDGRILARRAVSAGFTEPHRGTLPRAAVFAEIGLPQGASSVSLLAGGKALTRVSLRGSAPAIKNLQVRRGAGALTIRWHASDPDSSGLRYAVRYERPQQPPLLLAAGLDRQSYSVTARYLGGVKGGRIEVEASDGVHTSRASSPGFALAREKPLARIVWPPPGNSARSGPVSLVGVGYDLTDGALAGGSLRWLVDGAEVGKGDRVKVRLAAGTHHVRLRVTNAAGQTRVVDRTVAAG